MMKNNAQPTIFDLSSEGRKGFRFPKSDVSSADIDSGLLRKELPLPELAEVDVVRHFTCLSALNYSVDSGFYPLGSCTMKYNPKICEKAARIPGFAQLHPLQPVETVQGALLVIYECRVFYRKSADSKPVR